MLPNTHVIAQYHTNGYIPSAQNGTMSVNWRIFCVNIGTTGLPESLVIWAKPRRRRHSSLFRTYNKIYIQLLLVQLISNKGTCKLTKLSLFHNLLRDNLLLVYANEFMITVA